MTELVAQYFFVISEKFQRKILDTLLKRILSKFSPKHQVDWNNIWKKYSFTANSRFYRYTVGRENNTNSLTGHYASQAGDLTP